MKLSMRAHILEDLTLTELTCFSYQLCFVISTTPLVSVSGTISLVDHPVKRPAETPQENAPIRSQHWKVTIPEYSLGVKTSIVCAGVLNSVYGSFFKVAIQNAHWLSLM